MDDFPSLVKKAPNLGMACKALHNVPAAPPASAPVLFTVQLVDLLSVPPKALLFAASEVAQMLFYAWNISLLSTSRDPSSQEPRRSLSKLEGKVFFLHFGPALETFC